MALTLKGSQLGLRLCQTAPVPALQHLHNYSSEVRPGRALNTASMKRGRGGRSSFSGDVVTVFGSNGFIGTAVANRLGKNGSQIILPYRGEHYKMMRMKVVGDLGQVLFCPITLHDDDSIRRAVSHSNIVINLIGRGFETSNFSFEDVNVSGPQRIARICKEQGVQRLVHMSHINAREKPEAALLKGGSRYLSSKYQGELAVRAEFPDATIFRASDVYGEGDTFLSHWLSAFRKNKKGGLSLYGKGEMTIKQPIFRSDLATGIMNSLYDPSAMGQIYEAVGPDRMTQAELMTYLFDCTTRNAAIGNFNIQELLLDPRTMFKAWLIQSLPFGNRTVFRNTSMDRLERDSISDMTDGYPDMAEELGVKLQRVTDRFPWEVRPMDQYAYYHYETPDEKPVPTLPKMIGLAEEREILTIRQNKGMAGMLLPAGIV